MLGIGSKVKMNPDVHVTDPQGNRVTPGAGRIIEEWVTPNGPEYRVSFGKRIWLWLKGTQIHEPEWWEN